MLHHRLRRSNASVLLRYVPCVRQSVSRCIVASRSWKGRRGRKRRCYERDVGRVKTSFLPSIYRDLRINNASFSKRPLKLIVSAIYFDDEYSLSVRREFLNVCVFPSSYLFLSFHTADSPSVTTYVQSRVSTRMGVTLHMKHAYCTYRYHGEYLRMHLRSIVRCHSHAVNQSTLSCSFIFFLTSL